MGSLFGCRQRDPNEDISIALITWDQLFISVLFKDILGTVSLILSYKTMYWLDLGYFHTFITSESNFNLKSIISNGLIPGGQDLSKRQSVFFLPVDPRKEDHKDPEYIDYSVPRLARYLQNSFEETSRHGILGRYWSWNQRRDWSSIKQDQNAIILQGTLPANFIVRAERLKTGEKIVSKAISISSSTTEDLFEARSQLDQRE